jgi:arylsulfatase A-like enzyme
MNNITLAGLGLLSFIFGIKQESKAANNKPNFIFILGDDMGYSDLSCYNTATIKSPNSTPNLDRMATGGMRLTDCHSNGALSTPTRTALLTGRYQQRAGLEGVILENNPVHQLAGLQPEEATFAEVLKGVGYKTALFGKWHLGGLDKYNPLNQGFDKYIGFKTGNIDLQTHIDTQAKFDFWDGFVENNVVGYATDIFATSAIDFIKENKNSAFCIYIAQSAAHGPCQGPTDPPIRQLGRTNPVHVYPANYNQPASRKAMIEAMDSTIGQILDSLKNLKLDSNTLVIFMSDNGPKDYAGGYALPLKAGKGSPNEGGHRMPGLLYMPGTIKAGTVNSETVMGMDFFPTFAELAGINYSSTAKPLDGISIVPILSGQPLPQRTLFWRMGPNKAAVRDGKWKLVGVVPTPKECDAPLPMELFLYDLSKDISERTNLALTYPDVVTTLKAKFDAWLIDVQSDVPDQLNGSNIE